MPASPPRQLLRWLREAPEQAVDAAVVPGLTRAERVAAFALGGVARSLIEPSEVSRLPAGVQAWMLDAPTPPPAIIDELEPLVATDPDGILALLYSSIVRSDHRRQLGTFFTPLPEVRLMLDLWAEAEQAPPTNVIDVGAGVGVFTVEAARRWPNARVAAIDINPVTLGLLAVRLLARGVTSDLTDIADRVDLVLNDFTRWLQSPDAPSPGHRLILGNPPYTRAQLIDPAERARLQELTGFLCDSRASLSTLITAHSLRNLAPSDGLSLLLPAQWLESNYARNLRNVIWRDERRRVEMRLVDSPLFDGAMVDAVALLVGTQEAAAQPFRVARWQTGPAHALDRSEPNPREWRTVFDERPRSVDSEPGLGTWTLGQLADVNRGTATGANAFFLMDHDAARALPPEATTRAITRLAGLPDELVAESLPMVGRGARWLLTTNERAVLRSPVLKSLIERAEQAGTNAGVLCARRGTWYDLSGELRHPDVILSPMTQRVFRVLTNPTRAAITNNLYGISWHKGVAQDTRDRVVEWLRSDEGQTAIAAIARRQGAGLLKVEPRALRNLIMPSWLASGTQPTAEGTPETSAPTGRHTLASVQ